MVNSFPLRETLGRDIDAVRTLFLRRPPSLTLADICATNRSDAMNWGWGRGIVGLSFRCRDHRELVPNRVPREVATFPIAGSRVQQICQLKGEDCGWNC